MVFSSLTFLFLFLPVTLILYYVFPSVTVKNVVILVASLFFYAWGEPVYVILMMLSILLNFYLGLDLEGNPKKSILTLGIIANLFLIGYFKYSVFLVESINHVAHLSLPVIEIGLPVGISFYTFHQISYLMDVYRGKNKAQRSILPFAVYISMFPQLIAGPIIRYSEIETQLNLRIFHSKDFSEGSIVFVKGLAKKVLLANSLGLVHNQIMAQEVGQMSALTAWLGTTVYALQIYNDFSGYSDMAIGLGRMLGFKFPDNFDRPYGATSITDFWRKWHISLSSWFREYVYIPLGGNRCGVGRQVVNLLIVWSLTGLWHGAAWNFMFWGFYYGVLLILEKFYFGKIMERLPVLIRRIITFSLVLIGWVFFFSSTLTEAGSYLKAMFLGNGILLDRTGIFFFLNSILLIIVSFIPALVKIDPKKNVPGFLKWPAAALLFILCVAFLVGESYNPFLYFRF